MCEFETIAETRYTAIALFLQHGMLFVAFDVCFVAAVAFARSIWHAFLDVKHFAKVLQVWEYSLVPDFVCNTIARSIPTWHGRVFSRLFGGA